MTCVTGGAILGPKRSKFKVTRSYNAVYKVQRVDIVLLTLGTLIYFYERLKVIIILHVIHLRRCRFV